jgi:phosphatidylserine/phosphatidylglycerophosphate/cardiolipin synthase-like enzyme
MKALWLLFLFCMYFPAYESQASNKAQDLIYDEDFLKQLDALEATHFKATCQSKNQPDIVVLPSDDIHYDTAFLTHLEEVEKQYIAKKNTAPLPPMEFIAPVEETPLEILSSYEEHSKFLIKAFNNAKGTLLLTTYNLSGASVNARSFIDVLNRAIARGVKVYFYYDHTDLKEREINELIEVGVFMADLNIHSKILAVDNNIFACGSYNWLSGPAYEFKSKESTNVLQGEFCKFLKESFWKTLKHYREISYNSSKCFKYDRKFEYKSSEVMELEKGDEVEILSTPQHHEGFFIECFETAKDSLLICAPFISRDNKFLKYILPRPTVVPFLKSGKTLQIFYRAGDDNIDFLYQHFQNISYSNLALTPIDGLHRKSLIVDNKVIAEGSYNWFSSARSLHDDYAYMETSLIFQGPMGDRLIKLFLENHQSSSSTSQRQKKWPTWEKSKQQTREFSSEEEEGSLSSSDCSFSEDEDDFDDYFN